MWAHHTRQLRSWSNEIWESGRKPDTGSVICCRQHLSIRALERPLRHQAASRKGCLLSAEIRKMTNAWKLPPELPTPPAWMSCPHLHIPLYLDTILSRLSLVFESKSVKTRLFATAIIIKSYKLAWNSVSDSLMMVEVNQEVTCGGGVCVFGPVLFHLEFRPPRPLENILFHFL